MQQTRKRALALLLSLCMVFSLLPTAALAAEYHPADADTDGYVSTEELKQYLTDGLKVDLENDTISWPSLKDITYGSTFASAELTGAEVYLTQGTDPSNDKHPFALSGMQFGLDTTSVALYTLGQQTEFDTALTYTGVTKKGWDGYDATQTVSVLIAVERADGFVLNVKIDDFKLGAKDGWTDPGAGPAQQGNVYVSSTGNNGGTGASDSPYLTLDEAYTSVEDNGTIYVMDDLTLDAGVTFDEDKTVTILSYDGKADTSNGAFSILRGDGCTGTLISITKGTVTLKSITVNGQEIDAAENTSLMVVNSGAKAVLDSGVTLKGYKRSGDTDSHGAIFVTGNNSLVIMKTGALITGNSAGYGGGVMVDNSNNVTTARFLMEGGAITKNTSTCNDTGAGYGGAGVYVWGGTFEMTGGAITDNTSAGNGGGIEVYRGSAKLTGGEISGNTAQQGGGVLLDKGTLTMGGTIQVKDNKDSKGDPQNVYLAKDQTIAIDNLTDGADIGVYTAAVPGSSDVKFATGAKAADVGYFHSDNAKTAGVLYCNGTTDTPMESTGHTHIDNQNTLWLSVAARTQDEVYVDAVDGKDDKGTGARTAPYKTLSKALKEVSNNGTIYLMSNVDFDGCVAVIIGDRNGKAITITSDPQQDKAPRYTINCVGTDPKNYPGYAQFYVSGDNSLTLTNVIVDGNKDKRQNNSIYGDFFIGPTTSTPDAHSSLTLGEGTTLQNFFPRAVNVRGNGTVTMLPGSEIKGCEAGLNALYGGDKYNGTDGVGAGVYVCPKGTFDMQGGIITDNKADGYTGESDDADQTGKNVTVSGGVAGVFGESGAIFKMSGAPVVTGNTMNDKEANVFLNDGQTILLTGAIGGEANVGVYVSTMPSATLKTVTIAESDKTYKPRASDAKGFHSDKNTQAGVNYVASSSTIVLDYDMRSAAGAVDKDGNGYIQVNNISENTGYAVLDADGKPIEDVKAYDRTGKEIDANEKGWFTTAPGNAPITFKPIPAGASAEVVSTPLTGNTDTPADKHSQGTSVTLPTVNEAQLSAAVNGSEASITVNPADHNLSYAVVDADGKVVGGWKDGNAAPLVFDGLTSGTAYEVVTTPKANPSKPTTDLGGTGTGIKTPADTFADVAADSVTRQDSGNTGKDKIVISPTVNGQEYGVRDPETGETVWKTATDTNGLTFDDLDPNKDYEVVSRQPGSVPGPGVLSPAGAVDPGSLTGGVDADGTYTSITFPTKVGKSYAVVDKDGKQVWPDSGWQDGTGNGVTVSGLTPGEEYRVVSVDKGKTDSMDPANIAGTAITAMPLPAVAPNKDGSYKTQPSGQNGEIKRTDGYTSPWTDSITIKAEDGYSYAVRDKDGNYYPASSGTAQSSPAWQEGAAGTELTFSGLPTGKDYEVVKVPTAVKSDFGSDGKTVIPAVTEVPGSVSKGDVEAAINNSTGDGVITVRHTDSSYKYILLDKDGKAVTGVTGMTNPQTGNGGTITFKPTMPGQKYSVVAVPSGLEDSAAITAAEGRKAGAADVTVPTATDGGMLAGKDPAHAGKTTITIDPASDQVKYVLTDETGKVVKVDTAANGKVVFDDLDPNKQYKVYTVPTTEKDPSDTVTVPENAVSAKTPSLDTATNAGAGKTDEGTAVTFGKTTSSITVKPTETGKQYNLIDPSTGAVVGTWEPGTDDQEVTFTGLSSGKRYEVVVRDGDDSLPVSLGGVKTTSSGGSSGSGGSSSGGSSSSSTSPKVESAKNGKVSVSPKNPDKGDKVTITATPDKGYEVGRVTVTDKNGDAVKVTDAGDGKYTFTQPKTAPVTIKVTFEKVSEEPTGLPFTDVDSGDWYYDAVEYVYENGLMSGTSSTTFSPDTATTRGMIVTILYRLEGEPGTSNASYPDVAAGQYYTEAVAWASANGIVTGYTNGNFGPNDPITREQMAAILYRYAAYKGCDVSQRADLGRFSDSASISGYAVDALSWANAEGLITGTSATTLTPNGQATRAQVATILMRFCENIAEK